jgi:antirestriction protein ArdC
MTTMTRRRTPAKRETDEAARDAKMLAAHELMTAKVAELRTSEDWVAWLNVASKFHRYSFLNVWLMHCEAEDRGMEPLTHVAGFKRWLEMDRCVRKGEKGLSIFAPLLRRIRPDEEGFDPERPNRQRLYGFRLTSVFDVQQTDGKPLPERPEPTYPEGEVAEGLLDRLTAFAESIGFPVEYGETGHANGYTSPTEHKIVLSATKLTTDARKARTLIHEIGHALLHTEGDYDYRGHRDLAETEAESVAYVTGTYLGIDMKDYSFHYVADWAPDMETVTAVGQRVMKTSKQIIDAVDLTADTTEEIV